MYQFDVAVSFGPDCRPAHHLRRVFGRGACPSGVFDWQITSTRSVHAYLRDDFLGMLDRNDLVVGDLGIVRNKRTGTRHPHEFPVPSTDATLSAGYAAARSRHDHVAMKTRNILKGNGTVLICLSEPLWRWKWLGLWLAVRLKYPRLRFCLLAGPVDTARAANNWRGTAEVWDAHLAPFVPKSGSNSEDGTPPYDATERSAEGVGG